jgi:hypothetical protein
MRCKRLILLCRIRRFSPFDNQVIVEDLATPSIMCFAGWIERNALEAPCVSSHIHRICDMPLQRLYRSNVPVVLWSPFPGQKVSAVIRTTNKNRQLRFKLPERRF